MHERLKACKIENRVVLVSLVLYLLYVLSESSTDIGKLSFIAHWLHSENTAVIWPNPKQNGDIEDTSTTYIFSAVIVLN